MKVAFASIEFINEAQLAVMLELKPLSKALGSGEDASVAAVIRVAVVARVVLVPEPPTVAVTVCVTGFAVDALS